MRDGSIMYYIIIPREAEGYGVERVRLSVCPSVPSRHGVVCARELGMKELS